jgi:hypothetical protein
MALTRGKNFFDSQEAEEIRNALLQMTRDSSYSTTPTYSTDSATYTDHLIPFVDKHMNYLNLHPKMEASMYLANLKLKTRIR